MNLKVIIFGSLISLSAQFCHEDNLEECLKNKNKEDDKSATLTKEISTSGEQNENVTSSKIANRLQEFSDDELVDFDTRSIENYGAQCTSQRGWTGSCVYYQRCRRSSYSYSATCGLNGLVCCKGRRSSSSSQNSFTRRTTTSAPRRRTTTTRRSSSIFSSPPSSETCGLGGPTENIFGGKEAGGRFPFMVAIITKRTGSNFCGGVMITRQHVLTAAHCFDRRNWRDLDVRIGQYDLEEDEEPGTEANIRNVKIHERYEPNGKNGRISPVNDIAIITLDRIVTSRKVTMICLPSTSRDVTRLKDKPLAAGWGVSRRTRQGKAETKLRFATLDVFRHDQCRQKYIKFLGDGIEINDSMVCAGSDVTDTCRGDSGGPLMYNTNWTQYRWEIYGLVSFGPTICANPDYPGVFTRVDKHLDWIKRNTKN